MFNKQISPTILRSLSAGTAAICCTFSTIPGTYENENFTERPVELEPERSVLYQQPSCSKAQTAIWNLGTLR